MSNFRNFIVGLKGYDIKYKGQEIPYWSAFTSGHTPTEILQGKTKYTAVKEKMLPSQPHNPKQVEWKTGRKKQEKVL